MELDHVFVMVEKNGPEADRLEQIGLTETYRRTHKGQGTANICYCFENLFLELLWIENETEACSNLIARTGLYNRSKWRSNKSNPFGLAWREEDDEHLTSRPIWEFTPPYLPAGMSIPVSIDSDDLKQPFMFRSPGTSPPSAWSFDRRGKLQEAVGLTSVERVDLIMPRQAGLSSCLLDLVEKTILTVQQLETETASAVLHIKNSDAASNLRISLPQCQEL